MHERLSPRVQHGEEADLGAEMVRIGGDGAEGLGGGAEEDAVDHRFVLRGDGGDRPGHGEDDVEVLACRAGRRCGPRSTPRGPATGTWGSADSRQELYQTRVWPQRSHCSTWPPSAAVRHVSIAVMTRRWAVDSDAPACVHDRRRRSGGRCPPPRASGDPSARALRRTRAAGGGRRGDGTREQIERTGGRADLASWRCADSARWSRDSDGRAAVESCGRRCRLRGDGRRTRGAANGA